MSSALNVSNQETIILNLYANIPTPLTWESPPGQIAGLVGHPWDYYW